MGEAAPDSEENERSGVPWYRRTGAWVGMGTGPGALMTGAAVTGRVGPAIAIPAVVTGCLVLYFVCVTHGLQAFRSRIPMGVSVRAIFGGRSGGSLTAVMVLAMIGWCGFYMGVGGAALSDLVGAPQVAGSCVLGLVVMGLSLLGQERWNPLTYLTAGCAIALTVITVVAVPSDPPPAVESDPVVGFMAALGGMISYAVVFAMRVPDFTVDINKHSGVWIVGLTMLVPLLALAVLGVSLYSRTGLFNLADLLARTERPEAGQLFLTLSTVAPSVTAVYSSAISIESLVKVPHRPAMAVVAACATTLGITRFDQSLIGFLEVLAAVIPPALVVMLFTPRLARAPRSPHPLLAWLSGAAVALVLHPFSSFAGSVAGSCFTGLWLWTASRLAPRETTSATGPAGAKPKVT
jgi:cytosine permease